jgi:hypothetical protein
MRLVRFLSFWLGWIVVPVALIWFLYGNPAIYHWAGRDSDKIKNLAQVFAWFAAGCYFLYQAVVGYFVVNMSVSIDAQRQHLTDKAGKKDFLKATVAIKKGDRGTFHLHDAKIRVKQNNIWSQPIDVDVKRFGFRQNKTLAIDFGKQLEWNTLNVSPGEETSFAVWTDVGSEVPCLVEVTVMGTMSSSPFVSQWRASTVSFPCPDVITTDEFASVPTTHGSSH